jgi:hypothetical protein
MKVFFFFLCRDAHDASFLTSVNAHQSIPSDPKKNGFCTTNLVIFSSRLLLTVEACLHRDKNPNDTSFPQRD